MKVWGKNTTNYYKRDKLGYIKVHNWIKKHKKKSESCEECGKTNCRISYANMSQNYLYEVSDWKCLCPVCHACHDFVRSTYAIKMKYYDITVIDFSKKYWKSIKPVVLRRTTNGYTKHAKRNLEVFKVWIELKYTYKEIGNMFGLSKERIRQIVFKLSMIISEAKIKNATMV